MRIETLCTGDELLTGLTTDTNGSFLQRVLLERLGLSIRRAETVRDLPDDIVEALDAAAARCDAVVVSGGLGPTADDLTVACAARAAGVPLVVSDEALAHLEARFRARGVLLTPNNRKQALVPQGAEVCLNPEGTAPMLVQRRGGCTLFFLPGVPREYRALVEREVLPRLDALARDRAPEHGREVWILRVLKTVNLPESHLDARVAPLAPEHPLVTFGFRTHPPENHLKLLARASSAGQARAAVDAAAAASRALLGAAVFGEDDETLPGVVHRLLRRRGERVAVAESCTGGLLCAALTEPAGATDVFAGGGVTYDAALKERWAGVPGHLLAAHGAVSAPVAAAMAAGIRLATGAAWALSVTGFAGPGGGTPEAPVGTVLVGLDGPDRRLVERFRFHGDRERVRRFAAHAALDVLRRALEGASP